MSSSSFLLVLLHISVPTSASSTPLCKQVDRMVKKPACWSGSQFYISVAVIGKQVNLLVK